MPGEAFSPPPHPGPSAASASRALSPADPDTASRVTPVEVFFDVVFVFTVTQLAHVLEDHLTWAGFGRTVLILGVLWHPYTGYAWLTNHLPPRRPAQKIMHFAGMAGFLLTSGSVTLFLTGAGSARLALRLGLPRSRTVGAIAALATLPLGIWTVAGAQLAAAIAVLTAMLLVDRRRPAPRTANA